MIMECMLALATNSRTHQDIPKRDEYIRRTKGRIEKWQKAVVAYSAVVYVR